MNFAKGLITVSLCLIVQASVSADEHSREWTFSSTKDSKKTDISVSKCYPDESKSKISYTWYPNSESYENALTINCECNENLKLNDKVMVKLDGLDALASMGLPADFQSHMCVAVPNADIGEKLKK